MIISRKLLVLTCLLSTLSLLAQKSLVDSMVVPTSNFQRFLTPSDTFNHQRFYVGVGAGAGLYGAFSIGLWQAWYKDAELSKFHTFNDWTEWQQVDKIGHLYTAYNYARWTHQAARWTGMSRKSAAWTSAGVGMLLQTTTEVMDGYADKWGFSWGDMTFNVLGSSFFLSQELAWQEQRITMKVSSNPQTYPDLIFHGVGHSGTISIEDRTKALYGKSFAERFIKDYNAQVNWFSFNIKSFAPQSSVPSWLNVAVGYGAGNMVAGHGYEWTDKEGLKYAVDPKILPRYREFYLSTDIELNRLPIKNKLLRMLVYGVHHIKFPGPALEYNTLGKVKMHWLFW